MGDAELQNNDLRYSVKTDTDGNTFVKIDKDILVGVPKEKWAKTVRKNILNNFRGKAREIEIARKSATEFNGSD